MSVWERVRPYLPRRVRTLPVDLVFVVAVAIVTVLSIALPVVRESPLRAVVPLLFVLFVPGYAFVAALYPGAPAREDDERPSGTLTARPLTNLERLMLSLGSSVVIVPLVGLGLNATPWGLGLVPMLVTLVLLTGVCVAVAAKRRSDLPEGQSFDVSPGAWYRSLTDGVFPNETRADVVLNTALVVALLFATATAGYAVFDQGSGDRYTEFYVLSEGEDGRLVADDYPTDFVATESRVFSVGIHNHEGEQASYTVVTALQRVRPEDGETTVVESERLDSYGVTLAPNGTSVQERVVTPTMVGDRLRLVFLLYRGDPPAEPTVDNAYRWTHLSVNVSGSTR